ncbi:alpha/beta-hydrolase [Hymenopellis radicata]|nr:alpha/beta-hydrolase [Hymenopellis radicata]
MRLALAFVVSAALSLVSARALPPVTHFFDTKIDVEPKGKNVTINGVLTYVTLPEGRYDPRVALLFLTDVYGLPSPDNLFLADQWAAAGFATYAPDYLFGDALPIGADYVPWLPAHGENVTTPLLLAVIDELKSYGVTQFVAAGYCIGGLYVTRLVQNNTITVGTMSHPSFLDVPADFEVMKAQSHVPIEINNAEFDTLFTTELAAETDEVMVGQYPPGYKRLQYNGVGHGFTVGANASDPVQVAAKEGAFHASLSWIKDHLVY